MPLLHLPPELLRLVFLYLPRQSLARLCLTCHQAYTICLPTLYAHVHLGLRAHVRQLEQGVYRREELRQAMQSYTQQLTMTNQQNCNMWMARDFAWLFSATVNIRVLTLVHFESLTIGYLVRLAQQLPNIEHLRIQYSSLGSHRTIPDLDANSSFTKAKHLDLCWSDFSQEAAAQLLQLLPNVETVNLGANRNKFRGANTTAVQSLSEHCPRVKHLTISLQQVSESVLCDTITYYGPQLHSLSIRCDGRDTLKCVARHATLVKNLTIRAGSIQPPPQRVVLELNQPQHMNPPSFVSTMVAQDQSSQNEEQPGSIVGILQRCSQLVRLEMVSWLVEDVPREVWRGIEVVASRRQAPSIAERRRVQEQNKTFALGREELQEIRKQFVMAARTLQSSPSQLSFDMSTH